MIGVYIPGNITIGGGQTLVVPIDFIPNAGFVGGNSDMTIQIMYKGSLFCFSEYIIPFPNPSVSQMKEHSELSVTPNPAVESTEVQYKFETKDKVVLRLYNLAGVLLLEQELPNTEGRLTLDLNALASGTYIVVAQDASGQRLQQHIIKK